MYGVAEPEVIVEKPKEPAGGGPGGGGPGAFRPGGNGGGGGDDDESARRRRSWQPSLPMVGMLALLVSVTALFAALVIAYMARSGVRSHWEPITLPASLWVSTVLIVLSSLTLETARFAFRRLKVNTYRIALTLTAALGLGFMVSQALAFYQLTTQGVYLRQNPRSSLFYIVTGAHGLHLVGGMAAMFYLIHRVTRNPNLRASYSRQRTLVNVSSVYWHFLVALWIALFAVFVLWN